MVIIQPDQLFGTAKAVWRIAEHGEGYRGGVDHEWHIQAEMKGGKWTGRLVVRCEDPVVLAGFVQLAQSQGYTIIKTTQTATKTVYMSKS